jgi:hypothetical protein
MELLKGPELLKMNACTLETRRHMQSYITRKPLIVPPDLEGLLRALAIFCTSPISASEFDSSGAKGSWKVYSSRYQLYTLNCNFVLVSLSSQNVRLRTVVYL